MKTLKTTDELIQHMINKGIMFNIVSEEDAKVFLQSNNYYMKLASYRFNYPKYPETSPNKGKYINLEFAYLKELSTLDMYLRRMILKMCLDIEHILKVKLLQNVENNKQEDGYNIISKFLNNGSGRLQRIQKHRSSSYCKDLISKYDPDYPIWVFLELASFGDLTYLVDFYRKEYGYKIVNNKFLNTVRDMRNAAAHNNCIINNLFHTIDKGKQPDVRILNFIKKVTKNKITRSSSNKNLNFRVVYDFITLLYVYDNVIDECTLKARRYDELKSLFNDRMLKNKSYFIDNERIKSVFRFTKIVVDNL